jgi:DNA-binding NarL/FixJ family response regulator
MWRAPLATETRSFLLESGGAWGVGLDILAEVESIAPEVKTLLLADTAAPPPLAEAIIVGARGVVFHDAPPNLLFRAARTVAAGQYWVGRETSSASCATSASARPLRPCRTPPIG